MQHCNSETLQHYNISVQILKKESIKINLTKVQHYNSATLHYFYTNMKLKNIYQN